MRLFGTDEAGRGPLIGPMVMAGVVIDEKKENLLVEIGVKDSKLLTPRRREELFDKVKEVVDEFEIIIISPSDIDSALESPDLNLNWLEAITTVDMINKLKPDKAILDCPSNNPSKYKEYVSNLLKIKTKLIAEHKADMNYPVVAAASILAKVTRDREIEKLKLKYGDCGSGYPADPKTKAFLLEYWDKHPEIFRKSWASYKKIVKAKAQKGLGDF